MVLAFENFQQLLDLKDSVKAHREWLKAYEGLCYSKAIDGKHLMKWQTEPKKYSDSIFDVGINVIKELPNRLRIEFDDEDKTKIPEHLEKVRTKLKEIGAGYIESSHKGKSNYIWIEFEQALTEKEKKAFLDWIAPLSSTIDLNFSSHDKVFPVLFAVHWKHSYQRELPVNYIEGKKIDFHSLGIKVANVKTKKKISNDGYEYETLSKEDNFKKASELFSGKLKTANDFIKMQPLYYDDAGLWWVWRDTDKCWKMVDEVEITNLLMSVRVETINSKERNEIIQALKQVSRLNKPKEMPVTWIQFKDKIFDLTTGNEFNASPEYFTVNPIPYSLHHDKFIETPNMDRIFTEWVGEKYVPMLYEIISYCLIPDYPIHRLFCFIGGGMNGKSKYLNLIEKFVGRSNVCSTELDALLTSRFEVTRLHKKLVCIMGETNFNELSKTSILKKLTGQDVIGFEYKNKNPFEEKNYAKILISTNNLPETTDKTIGFYRRWTIIDFPNQFSEGKDILAEIPEEEYMALATKCALIILPELLKNRRFTNEGSLEERQKTYEDKSNPFDKFWKENIDHSDPNAYIPKWEFEKRFTDWCVEHRFRKMTDKFISQKMHEKEIQEVKPYISWFSKEEQKFVQKQVRSWGSIKWK